MPTFADVIDEARYNAAVELLARDGIEVRDESLSTFTLIDRNVEPARVLGFANGLDELEGFIR